MDECFPFSHSILALRRSQQKLFNYKSSVLAQITTIFTSAFVASSLRTWRETNSLFSRKARHEPQRSLQILSSSDNKLLKLNIVNPRLSRAGLFVNRVPKNKNLIEDTIQSFIRGLQII
jgi:hypothetical protein